MSARPCWKHLQTGGTYVNVHTAANAPGEIRGQLGVTASVTTTLNARQEVPKPKGNANRTRGTFNATVTKTGTTGSVAWRLSFSKLTGRASAAHIHIGAAGRSGPVAVPLCGLVQERSAQDCDLASLGAGCSRGGPCIREHPYGTQPGRRDPRSDPGCSAQHLMS